MVGRGPGVVMASSTNAPTSTRSPSRSPRYTAPGACRRRLRNEPRAWSSGLPDTKSACGRVSRPSAIVRPPPLPWRSPLRHPGWIDDSAVPSPRSTRYDRVPSPSSVSRAPSGAFPFAPAVGPYVQTVAEYRGSTHHVNASLNSIRRNGGRPSSQGCAVRRPLVGGEGTQERTPAPRLLTSSHRPNGPSTRSPARSARASPTSHHSALHDPACSRAAATALRLPACSGLVAELWSARGHRRDAHGDLDRLTRQPRGERRDQGDQP